MKNHFTLNKLAKMMSALLNTPMPFPASLPEDYRYADEPTAYDPDKHLALEYPEQTLKLRDLGYGD